MMLRPLMNALQRGGKAGRLLSMAELIWAVVGGPLFRYLDRDLDLYKLVEAWRCARRMN